VEEEIERRARAKAESSCPCTVIDSAQATDIKRRRTSISVSRVGQTAESGTENTLGASTPLRLPAAPPKDVIYEHSAHGSEDSLTSLPSDEDLRHSEDENRTTQVETIAGRKTLGKRVGGLFSRRVRGSRSITALNVPSENLVIDVSVEKATSTANSPTQEQDDTNRAFVYSPTGTRSRYTNIANLEPSKGWVTKAKVLTQKLSRKNTGE